MTAAVLAALFVLLAWWGGTAAILILDGLPRRTFRTSVAAVSLLALFGLGGLLWSSRRESLPAAYLGFACALLLWAWHELTFLLGLITGPRTEPCPPGARGLRRFLCAAAVLLYHEVALAGTLVLITALTWGAPNQVGTLTFLVLWTMRLSAKLNLFLGVRNLSTEFLPAHLHYLASYFRKRRMNPLMPGSLLGGALGVAWLICLALDREAGAFAVVAHTLVATLLSLAVLEHLFLALPLPDALLWRWALRGADQSGGSRSPRP